MSKEKSKLLYV